MLVFVINLTLVLHNISNKLTKTINQSKNEQGNELRTDFVFVGMVNDDVYSISLL